MAVDSKVASTPIPVPLGQDSVSRPNDGKPDTGRAATGEPTTVLKTSPPVLATAGPTPGPVSKEGNTPEPSPTGVPVPQEQADAQSSPMPVKPSQQEPTPNATVTPQAPPDDSQPASPRLGPTPKLGTGINDLAHPFRLPSAAGPKYSLEFYIGKKNVVLVFYRAFW